jgi:transposase
MGQERVTLTRNELKRVKVLERVSSGAMSNAEASATLGITDRQLRRLKTRYEQRGEEGLVRGNRGRMPPNALRESLKLKIVRLYDEKYYDSNFCHYSELLEEHENVKISPLNNHELIRRIVRKGFPFDPYSQKDISLMMNHIDSYARKTLGNRSPYETFQFLHSANVLKKLGAVSISPYEVTLHLLLLKK